jgi:hypothetical protein
MVRFSLSFGRILLLVMAIVMVFSYIKYQHSPYGRLIPPQVDMVIFTVLKDLFKPDHRFDASFCFQRCWLPQRLDRWGRAVISHSVNFGRTLRWCLYSPRYME